MMGTRSQMIPLSEAAFRMGVSWERAWRMVLSRQITGEKRGGRWFVAVEDLDLNSQAVGQRRRDEQDDTR